MRKEIPENLMKKLIISKNAPEYAKNLKDYDKLLLLSLQECYCERFVFGICGGFYPSVEIDVDDSSMDNLVNIFSNTFGKCKKSSIFKSSKKEIYRDFAKYEKLSWMIDKERAIEFFSIFDEGVIQPKIEKIWIHQLNNVSNYCNLSDEEIYNIYHSPDEDLNRREFQKVEKKLIGDKESNSVTSMIEIQTFYRRIQVVFGAVSGRSLQYYMKLDYLKNVHPITSRGVLKLSFFYRSYYNGKSLTILPHEKMKKRTNKKIKKKDIKKKLNKKQKITEEPLILTEEEKKRINEYRKKIDCTF